MTQIIVKASAVTVDSGLNPCTEVFHFNRLKKSVFIRTVFFSLQHLPSDESKISRKHAFTYGIVKIINAGSVSNAIISSPISKYPKTNEVQKFSRDQKYKNGPWSSYN